jgi:hypothetical protein
MVKCRHGLYFNVPVARAGDRLQSDRVWSAYVTAATTSRTNATSATTVRIRWPPSQRARSRATSAADRSDPGSTSRRWIGASRAPEPASTVTKPNAAMAPSVRAVPPALRAKPTLETRQTSSSGARPFSPAAGRARTIACWPARNSEDLAPGEARLVAEQAARLLDREQGAVRRGPRGAGRPASRASSTPVRAPGRRSAACARAPADRGRRRARPCRCHR